MVHISSKFGIWKLRRAMTAIAYGGTCRDEKRDPPRNALKPCVVRAAFASFYRQYYSRLHNTLHNEIFRNLFGCVGKRDFCHATQNVPSCPTLAHAHTLARVLPE